MVGNHTDRPDRGGIGNEAGAYRTEFDWSAADQPSAALVEVMARLRGVDPVDLEPLHDALDPDALNALFAGRADDGAGSVEVTIDGYRIRIDRAGTIVAERDVV